MISRCWLFGADAACRYEASGGVGGEPEAEGSDLIPALAPPRNGLAHRTLHLKLGAGGVCGPRSHRGCRKSILGLGYRDREGPQEKD